MDVVTKTVRREGPTKDELAEHVLEPGDLCWLLDTRAMDPLATKPLGWGVVVRSDQNDAIQVEAKIGAEPCQIYPRSHLRWMGK